MEPMWRGGGRGRGRPRVDDGIGRQRWPAGGGTNVPPPQGMRYNMGAPRFQSPPGERYTGGFRGGHRGRPDSRHGPDAHRGRGRGRGQGRGRRRDGRGGGAGVPRVDPSDLERARSRALVGCDVLFSKHKRFTAACDFVLPATEQLFSVPEPRDLYPGKRWRPANRGRVRHIRTVLPGFLGTACGTLVGLEPLGLICVLEAG